MRWSNGCVVALVLAVSPSTGADPQNPAIVWYRSSQDCPDGSQFLERLGDRASWARLAQPGDHVDFVVTVAATDAGSTGRLERETERGTIAMSQIRDPSCDRVVDALALSLALSLNPDQPQPSPAEPTSDAGDPSDSANASPAAAPLATPAPSPLAAAQPVPAGAAPRTASPPPEDLRPLGAQGSPPTARLGHQAERRVWLAGIRGGAVTGVAPDALAFASAFAEVDSARTPALGEWAASIGAIGALGSTNTAVGEVRHWIVAVRGGFCPVGLGGTKAGLWACAGIDLGATGASGTGSTSQKDSGLWVAALAHARLRWWVGGPVGVEAQAGAVTPLTRYEYYAASEVLYRTRSVGFSGALGALILIP